jgi:hypothetical protein
MAGMWPEISSRRSFSRILGAPPTRLIPLDLQDLLLNLEWQLVSVSIRPTAAIGQTLKAAILVSAIDLVAGLPRDIELPAQSRHLLAFQ